MRQRRTSQGFTLMEVMVTVIVVGTAIAVIANGFAAGTRTTSRIEQTTRAAFLATELVSQLETEEVDFLTETEGDFSEEAETGAVGAVGSAEYKWRLTVAEAGEEDLYKVKIEVTWADTFDEENPRTFELVRYFYRQPEDEEDTGNNAPAGQ